MQLTYEEKKELLSAKIRERSFESPTGFFLHKPSSNLFRKLQKNKTGLRIDKKAFNRVLSVDPQKGTAEIEGMATYEDIVSETLLYGCLPGVVPELKTITIGGAISGCGIESSSFKYGLVHEGIKKFDLLLADGRVLCCTPENEYRDLFFALPNSYGTFGYILKAEIEVRPIKNYVQLRHQKFDNSVDFFKEIERLSNESREKESYDYIEGVIFSSKECYITTGTFVSHAPYLSNYKYMNIYYRSIQTKQEDFLTVSDYIWRWDADWFWCSNVFYMQKPVPRFLLGKFLLCSSFYTRMMHLSHRPFFQNCLRWLNEERESVIQDVLIPIEKAQEFLDFFQNEIGMSPIWICPYRAKSTAHFDFCPLDPTRLYLDFGFWGSVSNSQKDGQFNRKIERKVTELNGFKSLYSSSYYPSHEFWQIYNKERYEGLKKKYDPHSLLKNLYSKCVD